MKEDNIDKKVRGAAAYLTSGVSPEMAEAVIVDVVATAVEPLKQRMEDLEGKIKSLTSNATVALQGSNEQKMKEMFTALFANQKLSALKCFKDITGMGLKDAKDVIDEIYAKMREGGFHFPNT